MSNLIPLAGYVVIERDAESSSTASGILLADTAQKEKPQRGTVISVGAGKEGKTPQVQKGQTVYFKKYGPSEVEIDGKEYLLLEEEDIFAIVQ